MADVASDLKNDDTLDAGFDLYMYDVTSPVTARGGYTRIDVGTSTTGVPMDASNPLFAQLTAGTAEIGKLAAGVAEIGNVKNSGTFVVQVDGDALTSLQLIDNAVSGAGFNITQFGGAAVPIGAGLEATAVRVTLPTDGTGVVTANLGATDNAVLDSIDAALAGTLTVDGSGVTQPVSGTVTANLSATDNAVLDTIDAVLDTINAKLVTGTVIGDVNLGATDNAVLDNIQTAVELIDNTVATISATDVQRVAIFDASDTQITSFGGGTQYAVDTALGSTPTGTLAVAIRDDALSLLTPVEGDAVALRSDGSGALWVHHNDPPGRYDTFGKTVTTSNKNSIDVQFFRGAPETLVTVTTANSATATSNVGGALFASSTNANGSVQGVTNQNTIYRSGSEVYALFTASFTAGIASSYMRIGLYDANNGFFVGYEGTSFGFTVRNNASDTTTAKGSWSEDTLSGAAGSKFTRAGVPEAIDLTKINVWRIRFGWLGSAPAILEVMAPDGHFVECHKVLFPNLQTTPSTRSADLPITLDITKTAAAATDLQIQTDCWGAGTNSGVGNLGDIFAFQTTSLLNNGATFSSGVLTLSPEYSQVQTTVLSSHDGSIDIYWYQNRAGTDLVRTLTIPYTAADGFQLFAAPAFTPFVKYEFTNNSGSNQTDFHFDTKFLHQALSPQIVRVDGTVLGGMVATVNRSVIAGETTGGGGGYVNVKVSPSGAVSATASQDGTWNITDISGTVSLPTGAATEATLVTIDADTGAIKTAVETIDDAVFADDAAFTLTSSKVMVSGAIRDDSLSTLTAIEGDAVPLRVSSTGALHVTGGGGGTEYSEDVATPATIVGTATLMERDDALTTVTPIEGDWIGLRGTAEGAVWTQDFNSDAILADTNTIAAVDFATETTLATIATDTGNIAAGFATEGSALGSGVLLQGDDGTDRTNVAVDTSGRVKVSLEVDNIFLTDFIHTVDSPVGVSPKGSLCLVKRDDALSALTPIEGDAVPLHADANGALWVTPSGTVTVDGSGVTQPVSGTVTANAGTGDFNVSLQDGAGTDLTSTLVGADQSLDVNLTQSVALDVSAATVTVSATALDVRALTNADVVTAELSATDNAVLDNIQTAVELIDDAVFADDAAFTLTSSKVMVGGAIRDDSLTTLTAVEGDAVPLRVSSTGALHVTGGGGGTEYNEDDATPATIIGTATLMERDDALTTVTPIEGDWIGLRGTAEGALWTQDFNSDGILADTNTIAGDTTSIDGKITTCDTGAVVISSGTVTANLGATDNAVLDDIAARTSDPTVFVDDADWTALTSSHGLIGGVYQSVPGTITDGDTGPLRLNVNGAAHVDVQGTVTVDGSGVTQPVSGTITANLGTIADVATQTTLATIDTDTGNIAAGFATEGSALGSGVLLQGDDGTDRTNVLVDTDGHLQVDVLTGGGGGTQYAVDDALGATPTGTLAVAIRDDALTTLTPVEGDAIGLRVGSTGALWTAVSGTVTVDGSGVTQPVSGTVTANLSATDNAVLDDIAARTSDPTVFVDDADWTALTSSHSLIGGVYQSAPGSITDGDTGPLRLNVNGAAHVAVQGTVTVDGSGVTQPVSGTITANLGTIGDVATETTLATLATETTLGAVQTAVELIDNAAATISVTDMLRVAIFDDSDTQITSFGGGTQYAVDAALGATPTGTLAVAIRDDALSALTPIEGDAVGLRTDANGALWVIPSGTTTVGGTVTANAGTGNFNVNLQDGAGTDLTSTLVGGDQSLDVNLTQAVAIDINNSLTLLHMIADDAAFTVGTSPVMPSGHLFDDVSSDLVNEGDIGISRMSSNRVAYSILRDAAGNERGVNVTAENALRVAGDVAHDAADAGSPQKIGYKAIAHGSNPTAVAASDRTDAYANRHGMPFVMNGHPNTITRSVLVLDSDGAQTNAAFVTVAGGNKIVVTQIQVFADKDTTGNTDVRIGFGATTVPTPALAGVNGMLADFRGIPPGGGANRGDGSAILGVGADGEDIRFTCEDPAGGNLTITISYYTCES